MSQSAEEFRVAPLSILKSGAQVGIIGGVVAVCIALQGMIQAFATRDIISGVVSMSQVLLFLTFFGAGYSAINKARSSTAWLTLANAALAGFLSSLLLVGLIAFGSAIRLGDVFINATPQLYELLTFKLPAATGTFLLLVMGALFGVAAGVLFLLPSMVRKAISISLTVTLLSGLLQELIKITLAQFESVTPLLKFLYETNGLSISGTITLFILVAALSFLWLANGKQIQGRIDRLPANGKRTLRGSALLVAIIILLLLPVLLGLYLSEVLDTVALYLLMGLGLNIVVGFAGLLDLGYVAFFAIGAYTVGILTSPEHLTGIISNWWLALPFAVVVAVFAGVVLGIPVLRMRGDYLAIVTLGFGEIIRLLALSDFLKPWEGGAQGIQGIPLPNIGPIHFGPAQFNLPLFGQVQFGISQEFYYLFLGGCVLVMFVATRVKSSRLGRAWMAIREDEDVAQAMGIDLVATKLLAFGMGASFGGLAGAIFASKLESVYPHNLGFIISVNVLSVIIIGGMGSIPGVIVGALALAGLPELLREVGDFRYLFYGAGLVIMMLVRPEGLLPEARRRMELEEFKTEGETPPASEGGAIPVKTMG